MNYKAIYDALITRARIRSLDQYTESHHVIPRCMGGSDDLDNLVDLTPEEHYVAHQLLIKMYPNNRRLAKAAHMMTKGRVTNKVYGWIRRRFAEAMKIDQLGELNSQFGTRWVHDNVTRCSKKISKNDETPPGWNEGRIIKWDNVTAEQDSCPVCTSTKSVKRKFCSRSCATRFKNSTTVTKFETFLEDMIDEFKSGVSIYRCLKNKGMDGTGKNFTKLKNEIVKRGL